MKITILFLAVACVLGLAVNASAQSTVTGTYTFNITITISSSIDTSTKISCIGALEVTGDKVSPVIIEYAVSEATRSGSTATCSATIPYSWILNTPTTDKLTASYSVLAPAGNVVDNAVPFRQTHRNLETTSVPSSGATTTQTLSVTM